MSDSSAKKPTKSRSAKTTPRSRPTKTDSGVLSGLSNTRPQRPSARRAAARKAAATTAAKETSHGASPAKPAQPGKAKPTSPPRKSPAPKRSRASQTAAARRAPTPKRATPIQPVAPRIPHQGFEAESEIEAGAAVHPPSSFDMAGSAVGLLGELAQSGVARSGRLLKGALSRLPKP